MQYNTSVPFSGNLARAFDVAVAALTSIGFRIDAKTTTSLDLTGPGMTSTRQSPLVGASHIRLESSRNELSIDAELGGVRRMSRFILLFPLGLSLFLFVVLVATFGVAFPEALGLVVAIGGAATGANALIWVLLTPAMTGYVRARSCRAIDALVHNMAAVGRDG